jgi:predicted DNA-binding transcriptional regulator YafY
VPFALVDDGFRWHVRGFDRKRQIFLDLVIARIVDARIIDGDIQSMEKPDQDIQWNRIVELELVPHPENIKHPDTIELDYGMSHGVLRMQVRAALVGYLLRRWNVDCSPDHRLRGMEYQLWLKNRGTLYGVSNLNLVPGYE